MSCVFPSGSFVVLLWARRLAVIGVFVTGVSFLLLTIHARFWGLSDPSRVPIYFWGVPLGVMLFLLAAAAICAALGAAWLDRIRRPWEYMVRTRTARTWIVLLKILLINLLAAGLIDSGLVLFAARAALNVYGFAWCGMTGLSFPGLSQGGYPGPPGEWLAFEMLIPNLVAQFICARYGAGQVSWRFRRNSRFVIQLWFHTLCYGLPLLALVFLFDIGTLLFDTTGSWWEIVVPTLWPTYCYFSAMAAGGRYVGRRAMLLVGKCVRCGYWLRGSMSARCPECGTRVRAGLPVVSNS